MLGADMLRLATRQATLNAFCPHPATLHSKSLRNWDTSVLWQSSAGDAAAPPAPPQPTHSHDVGVVVSFGYLLPPAVLSALAQGAINAHPSLLPRHRGASPIPHTLLAGDAVTGVSIIDVAARGFDVGALLDVSRTPVGADEGAAALTARLAALAAERLMAVLADLPASRAAARAQGEAGATAAPKLLPSEGAIRWDRPDACRCVGWWRVRRACRSGRVGAPARGRLQELICPALPSHPLQCRFALPARARL